MEFINPASRSSSISSGDSYMRKLSEILNRNQKINDILGINEFGKIPTLENSDDMNMIHENYFSNHLERMKTLERGLNYTMDQFKLNQMMGLDSEIKDIHRKSAFYNRHGNLESHYMDNFDHGTGTSWIEEQLSDIRRLFSGYGDSTPQPTPDLARAMSLDTMVKKNKSKLDLESLSGDGGSVSLKDLGYDKLEFKPETRPIFETNLGNAKPAKVPDTYNHEFEVPKVKKEEKKPEPEIKKVIEEHYDDLKVEVKRVIKESGDDNLERPKKEVKYDLGEPEKVEIRREQKVEDNLSELKIDFPKLVQESMAKVPEPVVKLEPQKKEEKEVDTSGLVKDLHQVISPDYPPNEIGKAFKKDDKVTVNYISKDKMFLITGTKGGFVHIWSFLQPYPQTGLDMMKHSNLFQNDRRISLAGSEDLTSVGQVVELGDSGIKIPVRSSPRKMDVLGWSNVDRKPDVSFKAHKSDICSVQITPKTFSKGQVDYVLVTSSLDKSFKIWKLSNLHKQVTVSKDKKSKDEVKIDLLAWLEDKDDEIVDAVFIPNKSNNIIVTKKKGSIEKLELAHLREKSKKVPTLNNLTSVLKIISTNQWRIGSLSTSSDYYAVGGENGLVSVYEVSNLKFLDSFTCKNGKGFSKDGKPVTGIEWNKKDNFLLVTTKDSRIRLLSFKTRENRLNDALKDNPETEIIPKKTLEYVEKFKSHVLKKKEFKARFFGMNEELVICPSESGQMVVWDITAPSYYKIPENYIKNPVSKDNKPKNGGDGQSVGNEIKNYKGLLFKIENKKLLDGLNIFNILEWEKLVEMLKKSQEIESREADTLGGCLPNRRKPKNQNMDPEFDLLMVSSPNGSQLKYSLMETRYFHG